MINYICTKRENLSDYLKTLKFIRRQNITNNNELIGIKTYYLSGNFEIEVDCYYNLNNLYIIRTTDENYKPDKSFIKAPNIFNHENILNGSLKVTAFTLEGTDGVGKTTVIENLINEGIICFDRNLSVICKYMLFHIPMEERIKEYKKYLENTKDKILFLINMDDEELKRRINKRNIISEFDKYAVEYNKLYYETYLEMKKRNYLYDNLFLLDCTNFTIEEQTREVRKLILR